MSDDSFAWLSSDQVRVGRRRGGFNVTELLDLSEPLRELLVEITRREPVSLKELTESLARDAIELEVQISHMVAQGWLDIEEDEFGEWLYRVRMARRSKRALPPGIWQVLDDQWQLPILRLFPQAVLEQFSSSFELIDHKAGALLFEAGSWGDRMYIVEKGQIQLLVHDIDGEPCIVRNAGPGDIFGEMSVLLGERRPYTAQATKESQTWELSKQSFDTLLKRHPIAALAVRKELTRQFQTSPDTQASGQTCKCIVVVGKGSQELAQRLADNTPCKVALIDLIGEKQQESSGVSYIDGLALRSKVLLQTIHDKLAKDSWVVVAAKSRMTDQLMRITNAAEVVIDTTNGSAPWLNAAAREYWVLPSDTPPQMDRLVRKLTNQVTGLIFSGGAARALAHLGVLQVLYDEHIPIDMYAGCGFGALWSVLLANNWTPQRIIDLVLQNGARLDPFGRRIGLRAASRLGLFDARSTRKLIQDAVGTKSFSDLEVPCHLATMDLRTGKTIWLTQGSLFNALSACIAMPGLITPVEHAKHLLVDAYMINPLPIDAIVEAGADIVIASTVISTQAPSDNADEPTPAPTDLVSGWLTIADTVAQERMLDHIYAADVLIAPSLSGVSNADFDRAEYAIECGQRAASEALPQIRSALFLER